METHLKSLGDAVALALNTASRIDEPLRQVLIKYQTLYDAARDYIHEGGDAVDDYQRLVDAVDDLDKHEGEG